MAITDVLNLTPEVVAEQNPELHEMRKIAFGENYLQDIAQGTGTAQYYTGWGNVPDVDWTVPEAEAPVVQQPVVQDPTTMIPQTGGGEGITGASVVQPAGGEQINVDTPLTQMITDPVTGDTMTVKEAFTQDDAYSLDTPPITDQAGAVAAMTQDDAYSLDSPALNALEQDIAQVAKDTTQAEFDALAPEIGYGVGEVDPKLAEAAGIVDYSDPNIDAMYTDDRIVSEEKALDPFAYTDRIMDPKLMEIQQQNYQDPSFWDTVKSTYSTDGISGVAANFGQSVADAFSGLAEQGINVGKMAGSAIMNAIVPGLGFVAQALPEYEPTFTERTLEEELGVTEGGKIAGDPNTSAFAGLNAVSAFGDPVGTAKDRIDTRLETIENNPNISEEFKENTQTMIDEWEEVTDKLGDIDPTATTGDAKGAEAAQEETREEFQDRMAGVETGDASVAEAIAAADRAAAETAKQEQASKDLGQSLHGDGGGNSGNQGASTPSGGGYSRGDYGGRGHHWSKGGIVGLKNAKR